MAEMTAAAINDLPDSAFAYIEPGGKVVAGKTEPRSLRHYPIHDEAHVRNAMARASAQMNAGGEPARIARAAMPKIEAAAKRMGIGMEGKAFTEMKAEPMTASRLDKWLDGKIARRILVVPFGGPIPMKGAPLGVDVDGEYFDETTDLYGDYHALRMSRERLVDWHHDNDPTGRMKGAILGRIVMDEEPESDGLWADFWANAGEQRRKLVAQLERRNVPLFGSTLALPGGVRKGEFGHIEVWPVIRHTISTSPQNTWAVVPSMKAILTDDSLPLDEIGYGALRVAMLGLAASLPDLGSTFREAADPFLTGGEDPAKAGRVLSSRNEAALREALDSLKRVLAQIEPDLKVEITA